MPPELEAVREQQKRETTTVRAEVISPGAPVDRVDLPKSNVERAVGVLVHGMRIAARLVLRERNEQRERNQGAWEGAYRHDAPAALLVPTVLRAPSGDIFHQFRGAAGAGMAIIRRAVSLRVISVKSINHANYIKLRRKNKKKKKKNINAAKEENERR